MLLSLVHTIKKSEKKEETLAKKVIKNVKKQARVQQLPDTSVYVTGAERAG